MTMLAMPVAPVRDDALRWGVCFAAVAAAHAAVALALLYTPPSPEGDFMAGAPVPVVDFPQMPSAPPTPPPLDALPGPEEAPSDATPPPKEETKPPETTADVALPEPPKPEPPAEARPATAPPSVTVVVPAETPPTAGVDDPQQQRRQPSSAVGRWQNDLYAKLKEASHYPNKARSRREQGRVEVTVRFDREGKVIDRSITKSSGWPDLDEAVLAGLGAVQFKKPPPDATDDDLYVTFPMNFTITK